MARDGFKGRFPPRLPATAELRVRHLCPPANPPLSSLPPGTRHTPPAAFWRLARAARCAAPLPLSHSRGELGAQHDAFPIPPYALIRRRALPLSLG